MLMWVWSPAMVQSSSISLRCGQTQGNVRAFDLQYRKAVRRFALHDPHPELQAGQATDVGDVPLALNVDRLVPLPACNAKCLARLFPGPAVERHRVLDIGHREPTPQSQPFRRDDVLEFAPLGPLYLYITFGDQALHIPVDGTNRHAQAGGHAGLRRVRVALDFFHQTYITQGFAALLHRFSVQNSVVE